MATNVMYRYVTTTNVVMEFVPDLQCVNVQMVLLKNLVMMKIQLTKLGITSVLVQVKFGFIGVTFDFGWTNHVFAISR